MQIKNSALELIGNTPMLKLNNYMKEADIKDATILAKLDYLNPAGSAKDRVALAMIEDAGITTTGAVSGGNQLPTLQEEYKAYRTANKLWEESNSVVSYTINAEGKLFRKSDGKEVELKW